MSWTYIQNHSPFWLAYVNEQSFWKPNLVEVPEDNHFRSDALTCIAEPVSRKRDVCSSKTQISLYTHTESLMDTPSQGSNVTPGVKLRLKPDCVDAQTD